MVSPPHSQTGIHGVHGPCQSGGTSKTARGESHGLTGLSRKILGGAQVAHSDLDQIILEFDILQLRKEQIEGAVARWNLSFVSLLKPAMRSADRSPSITSSISPSRSITNTVTRADSGRTHSCSFRARDRSTGPHTMPVSAAEPVTPAAFSPSARLENAIRSRAASTALLVSRRLSTLRAQPRRTKSPML